MTPNLTTQLHRAVFALPLLAIGLAAALATPPVPAPAAGVATTLPAAAADAFADVALVAKLDCDTALNAGARGLARMPGDISALAGRLRCAQ